VDVKKYMTEDLECIEDLLKELHDNIREWSDVKLLQKASIMFDAFHRRFALEDFLLRHVQPTEEMRAALKEFVKVRRAFREDLESLLLLHAEDPDFRAEIGKLLERVSKHMVYIKAEFDRNFLDRILTTQLANLSSDLESKVGAQSFGRRQ